MSRHKPYLGLLLIYFVHFVNGSEFGSKQDECKSVCADNEASVICQRGCRIFNIIDAKGDLDINKSTNDCHSSCVEAYVSPDCEACKFGCSEMQKKREFELSKGFVLYIEQDGGNNLMVVQPEIDQVDLDILSDPGLRIDYNIEYKIPETHIRTMPIVEGDSFGIPPDMTIKTYQGDWLDCASRNSGIPRWMLISAILLAVLLGIWLIFASEKREALPPQEISDQESLICDPPPKYSLESEKC